MDIDQATELIRKLADGVDPTTGERLPPSSVYQQADTVRALHLASAVQGLFLGGSMDFWANVRGRKVG